MYVLPLLIGSVGTLFLGRIAIIEIIALLWFLFFGGLKELPLLFRRDCAFAGLFYLSSLGLLLSDLINSTPIETMVKGVGAYFLFPTTLLFLIKFFDRNQLWLLLLTSSITSTFNSEVVAEFGLTQESFKFGFSSALVLIVLSISLLLIRFLSRFNNVRMVALISALSITALAFWGNLRLVALCAVVALVVDQACSFTPLRRLILKSRRKMARLLFFLIAFPLLLVSISLIATQLFGFFLNLFSFDFLSQDALDKTLSQSSGSLGVLFGGRSEIFSSYLAWIERPLFGWGSWAADPNDTFNLAGKILMRDIGYDLDIDGIINHFDRVGTYGLIPTHSALLSALVWGGIIGFFPLYIVICQLTINLLESGALKVGYCYPFVFVHVLCLWTLLFSPFGYSNRLSVALLMAVAVAHFRSLERSKSSLPLLQRNPRYTPNSLV
ncbi:hypothetical protein VB757_02420 [Synechococcus sp. BA-132 BA5]|nr:hypothetical protein [Synechococcus sp. BA-132 BA5]